MQYITTSCRNCGFRTRNHESNVPSLQIGAPISRCPNCGHLILDTFATEYEFMTERERKKFTTEAALAKSYPGNILLILFGLFFGGGMILSGEMMAFGLIFCIGSIAIGIFKICRNLHLRDEQIIEQAVYQSLQRTQNPNYVKFIEDVYLANKEKRTYQSFDDRDSFIKQYNFFESRESYIREMKEFDKLMELIGANTKVEQSDAKTFINP